MTTHDEDIDRGIKAERLLNDPLLIEAFEKVRSAVLSQFEASPVRDTEGREHLFKMLKALNDARSHLEQAMRGGKFALHLKEEKRRFSLFNR